MKNVYKNSTKRGILNHLYTRNDCTICKEAIISVNEIPVNKINLRGCASKNYNLCGQDFNATIVNAVVTQVVANVKK